jgi:kynurenine 3-monooxygenase
MAVIGDAAHGFLPFHGQGVSAAFGDCMEIAKLIDKYGSDWDVIFPLYQKTRKEHMDTLANLSKENFTLYKRQKKADYAAIYNKLESISHKLFPKLFYPPPFVYIARDPGKTADYVKKHKKQRKIAKFLGIPFLVHAATGLVAIEEKLSEIFKKNKFT